MAKELPPVLLSAMERSGLKGPAFAKRIEVRHQTLYGWLAGKHVPMGPQAERLAKKLRRPDLVQLIERDRKRLGRELRRAERTAGGAA